MKSRFPHMGLLSGAMVVLLVAACGDATESTSGRPPGELEIKLQHAEQSLQQTKAALADAERRVFSLRKEQSRDRSRIADLTASNSALEQRNRAFREQLLSARGQLAQSSSIERSLRQQNEQNTRRVQELGREHQAMRTRLEGAYNEIRQLRSRQGPDQRQMAELYQRGAAARRELDELRRYNAYLLQERGSLQAWLQEATAARAEQQAALRESSLESDRTKSEAEAANSQLRAKLEAVNKKLLEMTTSRDGLAEENHSLQERVARAAESERVQNGQLEKARARASDLAEANQRMARELQDSQTTPDKAQQASAGASGDTSALRTQLARATDKIAGLRAANAYLVDKIEACSLMEPSMHRKSAHSDRRLSAHWQPGTTAGYAPQGGLMAVAAETEGEPKNTRREKELEEVKKKLEKLEQEKKSLAKTLEEREAECAATKKQVETLTWANEVLVKELDAAYAAGKPGSLPKNARGMYKLRKGESLSRVAKAFYGDSERWKDLVDANKSKIPDPDKVEAGTVILIPE
jgi:nucleoid-associated protein YgaU